MSYRIGKNVRKQHPIKTEIYKRGLTIQKFAEENGISRFTLNDIFQGKTTPRGDTIYLISNGLNMPYEEVEMLCSVETNIEE